MATNAGNFKAVMTQTWMRKANRSEDANVRAVEHGAKRGEPVIHAGWINEPGDMPVHAWTFPDDSEIAIGDDGSFLVLISRCTKALTMAMAHV